MSLLGKIDSVNNHHQHGKHHGKGVAPHPTGSVNSSNFDTKAAAISDHGLRSTERV
jgi:hypothetical protein